MDNKIVISKKTGLKGEDGYKTFSIRIKKSTVSELNAIAQATNRYRNEIINLFLETGINNYTIEEN
ncbi:MAG: ribbon-helix-helix domain-containing protein [Firmicutes bacterium]|nr:ribbon-helix-helix domain-containing protein [Bacillota bacterium]